MSIFKRAFTSRWENGNIIEVDWSQLEINVLAIESQDPELTRELQDGLDLHTSLTADIYGVVYASIMPLIAAHDKEWTAKRRDTKRARFALQYGASAPKIAHLTGWTNEFAQHFIDKYYEKYAGVKYWQEAVEKEVTESATPVGVDGEMRGQYTSPSGRRYVFKTYPNKWGGHAFSPNQLKNYPIQGLASDFVAHMTGRLMRAILWAQWGDKVLLTNTIHDSIILDVAPGWRERAYNVISKVFDKAKEEMSEVVQGERPIVVPLKYDVTGGYRWSK